MYPVIARLNKAEFNCIEFNDPSWLFGFCYIFMIEPKTAGARIQDPGGGAPPAPICKKYFLNWKNLFNDLDF
jgi:hypothetical protein